jgi:putative FmdB family regulatory protein
MPMYEYVCAEDGSVVEALRSMADADKPLADPEGKGRTFTRRLSLVALGGARAGGSGASGTSGAGTASHTGGSCACGKRHGSCR